MLTDNVLSLIGNTPIIQLKDENVCHLRRQLQIPDCKSSLARGGPSVNVQFEI